MNFFNKVYAVVRRIPRGKVATYGMIAALCGNPRMSRQVGWALHANPSPGDDAEAVDIPCHRVVNKRGSLCTGFAFGGIDIQRALLEAEGVAVGDDYIVDMANHLWQPGLDAELPGPESL